MPLHDPIPYDRVAELIADVEPSRQSATLHDAWRDYARKAARPTFAKYARERLADERRRGDPTQLLQIVRQIQEELDWISPETARAVAAALGVPVTHVDGVVQFYSFLYDKPKSLTRKFMRDCKAFAT
jgi:NADH:ubiquinone oxidoreductase subunit E